MSAPEQLAVCPGRGTEDSDVQILLFEVDGRKRDPWTGTLLGRPRILLNRKARTFVAELPIRPRCPNSSMVPSMRPRS